MAHEDGKFQFRLPGMHEYEGSLYMEFMPPRMIRGAEQMEMCGEDLLFGCYPRSGVPYLSELVYLLYHDCDIDTARRISHNVRIRSMEHVIPNYDPLEALPATEPPRLFKTHLPAYRFRRQLNSTDGVKAVILVRDPRDMLVSFYHFYRAENGYVKFGGNWNEFFELFRAKQLFGGDWLDHTLSWSSVRCHDNVLILSYEQITRDFEAYVRTVAQFCNRRLSTELVEKVAKFLRDEVKEECPIGAWKDYFTVQQNKYIIEEYLADDYEKVKEFLH